MFKTLVAAGGALLAICWADAPAMAQIPGDHLIPESIRVLPASDRLVQRIRGFQQEIERRLGARLDRPIVVFGYLTPGQMGQITPAHPRALAVSGTVKSAEVDGRTRWIDQTGKPGMEACMMVLGQNLRSRPRAEQNATLAHELMHCYQFKLAGSSRKAHRFPKWAYEGSAEFAAFDIAGPAPSADVRWDTYLREPLSLNTREYDAMGFFFHLQNKGVNAWRMLLRMFRSEPSQAFSVVRDEITERHWQSWPMGLARRSGLGPDWDTTGPGITGTRREITAMAPGAAEVVPTLTQRLLRMTISEDRVYNFRIKGFGAIRWNGTNPGGRTERISGRYGKKYCRGEACQCPDGVPPPGVAPMPGDHSSSADLLIALTGTEAPGSVSVTPEEPECEPEVTVSCAGSARNFDPCLVGTWRMPLAKMREWSGLGPKLSSALTGNYSLSFHRDRSVSFSYNLTAVTPTRPQAYIINSKFRSHGSVTACAATAGNMINLSRLQDNNRRTLTLNTKRGKREREFRMNPYAWPFGKANYRCRGDRLLLWGTQEYTRQ